MPQCRYANFLKIAIRQIGQNISLDGILLEIDRVLAELESI